MTYNIQPYEGELNTLSWKNSRYEKKITKHFGDLQYQQHKINKKDLRQNDIEAQILDFILVFQKIFMSTTVNP